MRFSAVLEVLALLFTLTVAAPTEPPCDDCGDGPQGNAPTVISGSGNDGGQCGNGNLSCCNDIQQAGSPKVQGLLGALGAIGALGGLGSLASELDPNTNVGVNCKSFFQNTEVFILTYSGNTVAVLGGALAPSCNHVTACCTGQNVSL